MTTHTRARLLPLLTAVLTLILTVPGRTSRAQDVNLARLEPGCARIHASFGLDPALVTTVGYSRGFGLGDGTALWDADLGVAVAEADLKDLRARLGLQATVWRRGCWRIAGRGRLIARRTSNSVYDGAAFGADLTASAGWYRRGWFVAGLLGYDRTVVVHVEHSRWYRENVYDGAVDGWYRGESGILHGGVTAGFAAGAVEVAARLEWRRLDGGEVLDPPLVGGLTLSHPF
jgi:hypothetical protein